MNHGIGRRSELTFKHNRNRGRHGWLRLTPAYSVKAVQDILNTMGECRSVLDPFSGTGTTGLVCAEHGIECDLVEINPFLVWLGQAKTRNYTETDIRKAWKLAQAAVESQREADLDSLWVPPLHRIERWWSPNVLTSLARIFSGLQTCRNKSEPSGDLALIAFCRVAIEYSNAAFDHQSMSFRETPPDLFAKDTFSAITSAFLNTLKDVIASVREPLPEVVSVFRGDSRHLDNVVTRLYDCVITSPPYPNRISYVRELRPYMYWLGYLSNGHDAGELDWQAIGGTWGIATSRLGQWKPNDKATIFGDLDVLTERIGEKSPLLANYVQRYFEDMLTHFSTLTRVLAPGARVHYIIGNVKFYDTLVPVEQIYANLMRECGFTNIRVETLRKRNSKKELFEYLVSARWD